MTELSKINVAGVELWREYDFAGRVYRIEAPALIHFKPNGVTHRVTDGNGVVHVVPAPGHLGCVLRFKGAVIA